MAEELWTVDLKGTENVQNFYVGDPVPYSTRNNVRTSRYAHKHRIGNWDRTRPETLDLTPYDLFNEVIHYPKGELIASNGAVRTVRKGVFPVSPPENDVRFQVPSYQSSLVNEALIDALQKLKDQKFNAGVAMAEASGLAGMAADALDALSRARRGLREADPRKAYRDFLKKCDPPMLWSSFKKNYGDSLSRSERMASVPQSWLYYQFGIAPTISDINSLHEDWYRRHATPGRNTVRGVVRGSAKIVTKAQGDGYDLFPQAKDLTMEDFQSVRVYLHVSLENSFHARLAQMGATNLPEAGWNGMILSWMVDYFANIGDFLSVLDAGLGYEFSRTVESYRRITRYTCDSWVVNPAAMNPPPTEQSVAMSPYRRRRTTLDRNIVEELYPPMFRVRPQLRPNRISLKRFANMFSAFAGMATSSLPRVRI